MSGVTSNRPSFHHLAGGDEVILSSGILNNITHVVAKLFGSEETGHISGAITCDGIGLAHPCIGGSRQFVADNGTKWDLYFSYPLPNLTNQEKIAYAQALRGHKIDPFKRVPISEWAKTSAFLIEDIRPDAVMARMIAREAGWMVDKGDGTQCLVYKALDEEEILSAASRIGEMWATSEPIELNPASLPGDIQIGNVVIGTSFRVTCVDDRSVTLLDNATILPKTWTLETVSALFPTAKKTENNTVWKAFDGSLRLEPVAGWLFASRCARHALDEDEALVVAFPNADNAGQSNYVSILTSKGALFYSDDGHAQEEMSSYGLEPGIRHITQPRFWDYRSLEGEWDGGFGFEDKPADEETLRSFGLDLTSLGTLIRGFVEEDDKRFDGMDDYSIAASMMALSARQIEQQPALT